MQIEHIFAACQRKTQVAAFGYSSGTIAYASHNLIALYDPFSPTSNGPFNITRGHADKIQSVKWISRHLDDDRISDIAIVTASADKTVKVWAFDIQCMSLTCAQTLDGHAESVLSLGTLGSKSGFDFDIIVSGACDGNIHIWMRQVGEELFTQTQVFQLDGKFSLAIALDYLPGSSVPVLAIGGTDKNLKVYTISATTKQFQKILDLTGHTDWITCLDFMVYRAQDNFYHNVSDTENGDLLLLSGSQDKCVRLWRFSPYSKNSSSSSSTSIENIDKAIQNAMDRGIQYQISTKAHVFSATSFDNIQTNCTFSVYLDSVLLGHDDWIQSVQWHPQVVSADGVITRPLRLLTSSSDKSMIIWSPDVDTGIWVNEMHVGDIGGTSQGMFGALWAPNGDGIVGHGYYGDFHLWKQDVTVDENGNRSENWSPIPAATGHFDIVTDMSWDPSYSFLLSVSKDQTARVFAQSAALDGHAGIWSEIARPQVHGYDLQTVAFITPYEYVSGADGEKLIRMFNAPKTFASSLKSLTLNAPSVANEDLLPSVAALPALGLSNKSVDDDNTTDSAQIPSEPSTKPPIPSFLHHFTLWPECDKLYGHGDSIYSLTCSHDGQVLVSASIGRTGGRMEETALRVWKKKADINRFLEFQSPIQSHSLTVTDIKFSWSDKYFLSAGRDRSWAMYERDEVSGQYMIRQHFVKAHSRIIWSISWSFDDEYFCTGSRDKSVGVWSSKDGKEISKIEFEDSVTSVEFLPIPNDKWKYVMSVGFERGDIEIIGSATGFEWKSITKVNDGNAHGGTVKRVKWRVVIGEGEPSVTTELQQKYGDRIFSAAENVVRVKYQLATCSEDFSVRIWNVQL